MKKILFIEDEPALQKTFSDILLEQGYEVISALDGRTGLRLAKDQDIDLIILDIILPYLSGFDVLKSLKQDEITKYIPIIILTNLEEAQDIEKALSLGATTYLVKSNYSLAEVLEKIKKTLETKETI